jgi:hypothetical protein
VWTLKSLMLLLRKIHTCYLLFDEVIHIVVEHEVYTIFDGFFGYHQIFVALNNQYKIVIVTN